MKIKATKLMIGAGFILLSLSNPAAASISCKWCDFRAQKCATDETFFLNCLKKCPKTEELEWQSPIPKCLAVRKAHVAKLQEEKENIESQKSSINPDSESTEEEKNRALMNDKSKIPPPITSELTEEEKNRALMNDSSKIPPPITSETTGETDESRIHPEPSEGLKESLRQRANKYSNF